MDPALAQLGWTDEQWNRICSAVTEEAQRTRVAAQVLPVVGPEDGTTVAVPRFSLGKQAVPVVAQPWPTTDRLRVNSNPTLSLTTIAVHVPLRGHEVADPSLAAALTMFRRAANYVARIEDALVFNGRTGGPAAAVPARTIPGIQSVYTLSTDGTAPELGIFTAARTLVPLLPVTAANPLGERLIRAIVTATGLLEGRGQLPPFGCVLGTNLFDEACNPNGSFVMPRDRILPIIQGPLLRTGTAFRRWGALIALSGSPVELVIASDIGVQYLQTTAEPRYVFRVVERVALRVKEPEAIAVFIG